MGTWNMVPWQWYCTRCGRPSFIGKIYEKNLTSMGNFLNSSYKGLCAVCEAAAQAEEDMQLSVRGIEVREKEEKRR
jgi:hypothetical protein